MPTLPIHDFASVSGIRATTGGLPLQENETALVPEASGTWAETKATYDFWDSPYIKPAQLRKGHIDATLERIKNHQIILAIQDTTELNYTTHKAVKRVGYLSG